MTLIKVCCKCKVELGRQPLPDDYGKEIPDSYKGKDLISHGLCPKCFGEYMKEIDNGKVRKH